MIAIPRHGLLQAVMQVPERRPPEHSPCLAGVEALLVDLMPRLVAHLGFGITGHRIEDPARHVQHGHRLLVGEVEGLAGEVRLRRERLGGAHVRMGTVLNVEVITHRAAVGSDDGRAAAQPPSRREANHPSSWRPRWSMRSAVSG